MNKKGNGFLILIVVVIGALYLNSIGTISLPFLNQTTQNSQTINISPKLDLVNITYNVSEPPATLLLPSIRLCNWNLEIFGPTKASDPDKMAAITHILKDCDVAFIQEIRDYTGDAFTQLCESMPAFECAISSRAGRSYSKEQYGVMYKRDISLIELYDFNPDSLDRWERPPISVTFSKGNYTFTAYNIHTKPDDAPAEMTYLEQIVEDEGNVVILGDLNADCKYYDVDKETHFEDWYWLIDDSQDTTSTSTDCAYDRIIFNQDLYDEYVAENIRTSGITESLTDHYMVYAIFIIVE